MYIGTFQMLRTAAANIVPQFRWQPSTCCMAYVFGFGCCPCPLGLPLATEHGRARTLQERFNEGYQNSIFLGVEAVLGITSGHIVHLVCALRILTESTAQNPYLGFSTISLCECAVGRKSPRCWLSYWDTATQFVSSFVCRSYLVTENIWTVRDLFFYHHRSVNLPSISSV